MINIEKEVIEGLLAGVSLLPESIFVQTKGSDALVCERRGVCNISNNN